MSGGDALDALVQNSNRAIRDYINAEGHGSNGDVLLVIDTTKNHDIPGMAEMHRKSGGAACKWLQLPTIIGLFEASREAYNAADVDKAIAQIQTMPEIGNRWIVFMSPPNFVIRAASMVTSGDQYAPKFMDDVPDLGPCLNAAGVARWIWEMDLEDVGNPEARAAIARFKERVQAELQAHMERGEVPDLNLVLAKVADLPRLERHMAGNDGATLDILDLLRGPPLQ